MWIDIAKTIIELFNKSKAEKIENRKRLSEIFGEIGDVLMNTAEQMDKDIYPQGNCEILRNLSNSLCNNIDILLPDMILWDFYNKLKEASDIELQFAKRKDKGVIQSMYEAVGLFKAASILYK